MLTGEQQYVGRVAYTDDNGLMLPQTVQQLMRLGTNLSGPARVSVSFSIAKQD